jgi:hypothetical protein
VWGSCIPAVLGSLIGVLYSFNYASRTRPSNTIIAPFFRISKPSLRVEYIHCAILLGYVEDILLNAIISHPDLDLDTKNAVARAVNKVRFESGKI